MQYLPSPKAFIESEFVRVRVCVCVFRVGVGLTLRLASKPEVSWRPPGGISLCSERKLGRECEGHGAAIENVSPHFFRHGCIDNFPGIRPMFMSHYLEVKGTGKEKKRKENVSGPVAAHGSGRETTSNFQSRLPENNRHLGCGLFGYAELPSPHPSRPLTAWPGLDLAGCLIKINHCMHLQCTGGTSVIPNQLRPWKHFSQNRKCICNFFSFFTSSFFFLFPFFLSLFGGV